MRDLINQLAANLCRDYAEGLRGISKNVFIRVLFHINLQENDKYYENMLEVKTVDSNGFSEEEKWIDSLGSKLSILAKSIEQDIQRGRQVKIRNSNLGLPTTILLYLPEGKSFKQTVEQLKLRPYLNLYVSFDYYGKIASSHAYAHFIKEASMDEDRGNQFKAKTSDKDTVVKANIRLE